MHPLAAVTFTIWGALLLVQLVREVKMLNIVSRTDAELKKRGYRK